MKHRDKIVAITNKLREQANEMESPYWTKIPQHPDWNYVARAFREIANQITDVLLLWRES